MTAGTACSKGSVFISVISARRTCQGGVPPVRDAERDRDSCTWSTLVRRLPITAVKLLLFMGTVANHRSMLAVPKSIILSRLWLLVPPLASVPQPEVRALDPG